MQHPVTVYFNDWNDNLALLERWQILLTPECSRNQQRPWGVKLQVGAFIFWRENSQEKNIQSIIRKCVSYLYIKQYSISLHTYTFQKHCIQLGKWWNTAIIRNEKKNNSKFTVSLPWSYRNTLPIRRRELGFESRPESRGQFKKKQ